MSEVLDRLLARHVRREAFGADKYGATMDRSDLSGATWAAHLQEELMDAALYAERVRSALLLLEEARPIIEAHGSSRSREWLDKFREQFGGGS